MRTDWWWRTATAGIALLALVVSVACQDEEPIVPASLRSPKSFVFAPQCRDNGTWLPANECPEGIPLLGRGYVTNEESASLAYIDVTDTGAELIDTRPSIPGVTPVLIGARPSGAATTRDGAFIVTTNTLTADISVVEVARSRELTFFGVSEIAINIERAPDSDDFWLLYPSGRLERRVLDYDCGSGPGVYVDGCELTPGDITFDGETLLTLSGSPRTLAFDPVTPRLYVAYADLLYVSAIALEGSDETCLDGSTDYPCEVQQLPGGYSCADGLDNDGDGFADGQDPQCYRRSGAESPADVGNFTTTECNDVKDNDFGTDDADGLMDLFDPGCESSNDASELDGFQELVPTQCTDGLDNDNDGLLDNRDPDCLNENDDNESGSTLFPACNDGFDNDGDGDVDFPDDADCDSIDGNSESEMPSCADGIDNDGDGLTDLDDDGCASPYDVTEVPDSGVCNNGIDDDGDGATDLGDFGCYGANGPTEKEVSRVGLGPIAVSPDGRYLYIADGSEWTAVVVDIEAGVAIDAGGRNPLSDAVGVRVNPLPTAVIGDIRNTVIYDEENVRIERDEDAFYVASSAGTLDFAAVSQTFRRFENEVETDVVELEALRISDNRGEQANVVSKRCVGGPCPTEPDVTLRKRKTVFIGEAGEFVFENEDGTPATAPADDIFRAEAWQLTYEGVLPNGLRNDGVVDPETPGRISIDGNFCTLGVRAGDFFEVAEQPVLSNQPPCNALVPVDGVLVFRVASVRSDAIVVESLDGSDNVPLRECYPFGLEFQLRADDQWVVVGESTSSLLRRETRGGVCVDEPNGMGPGRFAKDERYENAFFSTDVPEDFPFIQDRGFQFSVNTGYSPLRRTIGPLPGDIDIVDLGTRRLIFVPDAGSNQVFIYDADTLRALESL